MFNLHTLLSQLEKEQLKNKLHSTPTEYHFANIYMEATSIHSHTLYICDSEDGFNALCGNYFTGCVIIPDEEGNVPLNISEAKCEYIIWDECVPCAKVINIIQDSLSKNLIRDQLYKLAVNPPSGIAELPEFIRHASIIIGNPISVYDKFYNVITLESQGRRVNHPFWQEAMKNGKMQPAEVHKIRALGYTDQLVRTGKPALINTETFEKLPVLTYSAWSVDGEVLAHISIYQVFRPILPEDSDFLIILSDAVSKALSGSNHEDSAKRQKLYASCLRGLLSEGYLKQEKIQQAMELFQWSAEGDFAVGYINSAAEPSLVHHSLYLAKLLSELSPDIVTAVIKQDIYLLLHFKSYKDYMRLVLCLSQFLKNHDMTIGISHSFSSLEKIKLAAETAKHALEMGLRFEPNSYVHEIRDHLLRTVLIKLSATELEALYYSSPVASLERYDSAHSADYHQTLQTYIDSHADMDATADKLFIHKNTLLYRLRRMKELAGIDISDPHNVMECILSLEIRKLLGGRELSE